MELLRLLLDCPTRSSRSQIEHKAAFLRGCPQNVSVVLIGHSIGAWINLQVMKRYPDLRVRHAINLFPSTQLRLSRAHLTALYIRTCTRACRYSANECMQTADCEKSCDHLTSSSQPFKT